MTNTKSEIHTASGTIMGGPWQVQHRPVAGLDPNLVAAAALDALRLVDDQMSNYRDDSDLMRLNAAPVGISVPVPENMIEVMTCADRLSALSQGALNIGLGKAVNRWGFGPDPTPEQRPAASLSEEDAASAALGNYTLCAEPPAVTKHANIRFDLCALAKGYAVDLAAHAVEALGVQDFLIEASGEIYAKGQKSPGTPWNVGLELPIPGDERVIYDEVSLQSRAVATSGGYRNRRQVAGETVSHTIDPATGTPLDSPVLSVTVLNEKCMAADALATVLYVLGPTEGPRFADENEIAALFMIREAEGLKEIRSEAFAELTQ